MCLQPVSRSPSSIALTDVAAGSKKNLGAYCRSPTIYSVVIHNDCQNTLFFEQP